MLKYCMINYDRICQANERKKFVEQYKKTRRVGEALVRHLELTLVMEGAVRGKNCRRQQRLEYYNKLLRSSDVGGTQQLA